MVIKRIFDFVISAFGLMLFAPILAAVALAIRLDSSGPVFFRGERAGLNGKPFRIWKFRTMVADAVAWGVGVTHRGDPRITRVGRFLRRTKIDEVPQLVNVLLGDMSLVGPRPEDPRYLRYYTAAQRQVLSVRPGISSIAALRYRNEEQLLPANNWEKVYVNTVLPAKLDIEVNYLKKRSLVTDVLILLATALILLQALARFDVWSQRISRLEAVLSRYALSWVVADVFIILAAHGLGFYIRYIDEPLRFPLTLIQFSVSLSVYLVVNYLTGVYRRFWSFASSREVSILFASALISTFVITLVNVSLPQYGVPLGGIWLGGFFSFLFMAAARYRRRLVDGVRQSLAELTGFISGGGARVLVIGAGEEGQLLVLQLQTRLQGQAYDVVGLVDDDPRKRGMLIHNVPVYGGRQKIPELAATLHPDLIILAIPPRKVRNPRELLGLCRATSAQIKIIPGLFDWLGHNSRAPGWEDINEEDLLLRSARRVDEAACRRLLLGRAVMVTGAAGSIGSELCRQIAAYQPERLILVDINESGLHDLVVELRPQAGQTRIDLVLGDISDPHKMQRVFESSHPQIVFHAAAYKHVPILEQFPQEGVRVNILGTRIIHSLAEIYGAERFVLISSDKAVNPSNVLGMTKWVGELIATDRHTNPHMLSTAVRFGNVLGSRGSVLPTFEKQIEMGGPITITHPDMTRYFLTISEAVSLVIQAAAMTRGGDLYALDMGVPVRIVDLAQRMIRAHGLRPGQDIAIEYTGMRPGEKLNEELIAPAEETCPTEHQAIFRIERRVPLALANLEQEIDQMVAFSANGSGPDTVRSALRSWISQLQSAASIPVSIPTVQV